MAAELPCICGGSKIRALCPTHGWGLLRTGQDGEPMILMHKSPTADTRTCDPSTVDMETLLASSHSHINDVRAVFEYFVHRLRRASTVHDFDKVQNIQAFHQAFTSGAIMNSPWLAEHKRINRHHLNDPAGVPEDVNLFDVLDYIADCVAAGMARSGKVWPLDASPELLVKAFHNTVNEVKSKVQVID